MSTMPIMVRITPPGVFRNGVASKWWSLEAGRPGLRPRLYSDSKPTLEMLIESLRHELQNDREHWDRYHAPRTAREERTP